MRRWALRIHRPAGQATLHEVQAAVQNLAEQAGLSPGKARVVFQTVTDVALLGTVLLSGALAAVHLYRAIMPRHREDHPGPEPGHGDRSPPRRRGPRGTVAAGDRGSYEDDESRSR